MLSEDITGKLTRLSEVVEGNEVSRTSSQPALLPRDASRQNPAWDLLHAPKNYLALISAQALGSLLSFSSVWLATRYLGPAGYGGVVALITAAQIAMMVAVSWTSISVARYGCEEFVRTGQIASTFWTRLIILAPNLLVVLATAPFWLPRLAGILDLPPNSTWLVLALLLVNVWWIHIQQALQGAKLMRSQGWLLTLERALILLVLSYLALSGSISVWNDHHRLSFEQLPRRALYHPLSFASKVGHLLRGLPACRPNAATAAARGNAVDAAVRYSSNRQARRPYGAFYP